MFHYSKKQLPVSAKVILKWKNKVFITQHSSEVFDFPGGKVKFGESLVEALGRELREEIQYTLESIPELFDVWDYISKDKKRHRIFIYFIVELTKKPKFKTQKGIRYFWFTKEQFLQKNIVKERAFLEKIFRWHVNPVINCNNPKYWDKIYKREFKSGEVFEEWYHRNYRNVFEKIIELIPDGSSVLDVACGPGIFCRALKQKKPKTRVVGVDFSDFVIKKNKERDKKLDVEYLRWDIRKNLPFKKEVDVMVMTEIIEHLKNPEKVLPKLLKFLKRGGTLFISCPHDNDVEHWMKKYSTGGEHLRIWTHDDIFHLLSKYSDEVHFLQLKPLKPRWIEWHILAYIKKK